MSGFELAGVIRRQRTLVNQYAMKAEGEETFFFYQVLTRTAGVLSLTKSGELAGDAHQCAAGYAIFQ